MKENMEPETIEDVFILFDLYFAFRAIDEIETKLKNQRLISWRDWPILTPFFFIGVVWIYAILR